MKRFPRLLGLLPTAIVLFSIIAAASFLRFYLRETAWQFASSFEKQNLVAIQTGDVFTLSSRLNALGASVRATCVSASRGEHSFFTQSSGVCSSGLLREHVWVASPNQGGIRIDFTLRLPRTIEAAAAAFLTLQLCLLGLLFLGVRKAEQIRSEGARRLGELAAQVAHDIRSPLAALETLLPVLEGHPEEEREMAQTAVARIAVIAEDLLERNRSVDREPPESTSLGPLAAAIVNEKKLRNSAVSVITLPPKAPVLACVEPSEFSRVVSNLIGNAIEACGGSGTVEIAVAQRDQTAVVSIKDDGPGIEPDVLARLGERGASFGKAGGSGLGLFHARKAAERWGGRLVIESEPGRGTDVRVEIPIAV